MNRFYFIIETLADSKCRLVAWERFNVIPVASTVIDMIFISTEIEYFLNTNPSCPSFSSREPDGSQQG